MADLTTKQRNKLPDSAFALPGRRYPIHDRGHAQAALGRVAEFGTPEEKAKVRRAVMKRYPDMNQAEKPPKNVNRAAVMMNLGKR